jgi:hypothetical protein
VRERDGGERRISNAHQSGIAALLRSVCGQYVFDRRRASWSEPLAL